MCGRTTPRAFLAAHTDPALRPAGSPDDRDVGLPCERCLLPQYTCLCSTSLETLCPPVCRDHISVAHRGLPGVSRAFSFFSFWNPLNRRGAAEAAEEFWPGLPSGVFRRPRAPCTLVTVPLRGEGSSFLFSFRLGTWPPETTWAGTGDLRGTSTFLPLETPGRGREGRGTDQAIRTPHQRKIEDIMDENSTWSPRRGAAERSLISLHEVEGSIPGLVGLRIWRCRELQCRSQTRLGSGVAVVV